MIHITKGGKPIVYNADGEAVTLRVFSPFCNYVRRSRIMRVGAARDC